MKNSLIIIGAGGHGKVVAEAAKSTFNIAGIADDQLRAGTEIINGITVIATTKEIEKIKKLATHFIVAIGNNEIRKKIFDTLSPYLKAGTIIHPSAVISENSEIGSGSVVLANTVISSGARIGKNCIINSQSLVDHDTHVGDHSHISQGTIVGSNCNVSEIFTSELGQRIKSFSTI